VVNGGLSAGQNPKHTQTRTSSGHGSKNELWTVRGLGADCPLYKNQQLQKGHINCSGDPRLSAVGPGLSAGQKNEKHTKKLSSDLDKPRLLDYLPTRHGLSANRADRRTERPENCLFTLIHKFAAKTSPTATKLGERDHKIVGELPLRAHRSI
jgi:hypothetical protein